MEQHLAIHLVAQLSGAKPEVNGPLSCEVDVDDEELLGLLGRRRCRSGRSRRVSSSKHSVRISAVHAAA